MGPDLGNGLYPFSQKMFAVAGDHDGFFGFKTHIGQDQGMVVVFYLGFDPLGQEADRVETHFFKFPEIAGLNDLDKTASQVNANGHLNSLKRKKDSSVVFQ